MFLKFKNLKTETNKISFFFFQYTPTPISHFLYNKYKRLQSYFFFLYVYKDKKGHKCKKNLWIKIIT